MTLPKLNIDIPQVGYSIDDGESVLRAKLSSGPSRLRLDMLDAPIGAQVNMVLSPAQYQYWRAFYRTIIEHGVLPFLLDLVVDSAIATAHEVKIVPGSLRTGVQGDAHIVQMALEVTLNPYDPDTDAAFVAIYDSFGDNASEVLGALEHLVNFDLPAVMP